MRACLDEIDDAEQEDRAVAELEHVSDLDGRRDVAKAQQAPSTGSDVSVRG